MLTEKWKILLKPIETDVENAITILKAICLLHNIINKCDGIASLKNDTYGQLKCTFYPEQDIILTQKIPKIFVIRMRITLTVKLEKLLGSESFVITLFIVIQFIIFNFKKQFVNFIYLFIFFKCLAFLF